MCSTLDTLKYRKTLIKSAQTSRKNGDKKSDTMAIKNLVIACNRSAGRKQGEFARSIYDALLRNPEIGKEVRFLDIRGQDFEDTGVSVKIYDDSNDNENTIERRTQVSEIE